MKKSEYETVGRLNDLIKHLEKERDNKDYLGKIGTTDPKVKACSVCGECNHYQEDEIGGVIGRYNDTAKETELFIAGKQSLIVRKKVMHSEENMPIYCLIQIPDNYKEQIVDTGENNYTKKPLPVKEVEIQFKGKTTVFTMDWFLNRLGLE